MLIVGLTGGIGTGKSTVSNFLVLENVKVIDADQIAKDLVKPYSRIWTKLVDKFGHEIINPLTHEIDRKRLGNLIFSDVNSRKVLNSIMHPAIVWEIVKQVLKAYICGEPMVVLDIPLLFETGCNKFTFLTVVVYCKFEEQVKRIMNRDSVDYEAACRRIASQEPITEKCEKADMKIDNEGNLESTKQQVHDFILKFRPSKIRTWFWVSFPFVTIGLIFGACSWKIKII